MGHRKRGSALGFSRQAGQTNDRCSDQSEERVRLTRHPEGQKSCLAISRHPKGLQSALKSSLGFQISLGFQNKTVRQESSHLASLLSSPHRKGIYLPKPRKRLQDVARKSTNIHACPRKRGADRHSDTFWFRRLPPAWHFPTPSILNSQS